MHGSGSGDALHFGRDTELAAVRGNYRPTREISALQAIRGQVDWRRGTLAVALCIEERVDLFLLLLRLFDADLRPFQIL